MDARLREKKKPFAIASLKKGDGDKVIFEGRLIFGDCRVSPHTSKHRLRRSTHEVRGHTVAGRLMDVPRCSEIAFTGHSRGQTATETRQRRLLKAVEGC